MSDLAFVQRPGGAAHSAIDADGIVRGLMFVLLLLLIWVSPQPFQSLADPPLETTGGGSLVNQSVFGLSFLLLGGWAYFTGLARLKLLLRPAMVLTLAWFAVTVVTSWEPSLSARRFVFTLIVLALAAIAMLLPKTVRHFADLLAATVLMVLALCYLGVLLAPAVSIHQATDFLEPEHAGNWRGLFPHKNQAGAMMAVFVMVGMFVARMRSVALGGAITALSLVFLLFTSSKTPIGLLPITLIMAAVVGRVRPSFGIALAAGSVLLINLATVGSAYFDSIFEVLKLFMSDPTFTARSDIWKFALTELAHRPLTGYGFSAFWGTEQVVFGLSELGTWATAATDAHNAYLNIAVTTGVPGLLFAVYWLTVVPLQDYYRRADDAQTQPLATFFLRIWLFGIYSASFESVMFPQVGELWFIFIMAVFGLRYLTVARAAPA